MHDYNETLYQELPKEIIDSFCGVGNPFLPDTSKNKSLLDIGCGSGLDMIIASKTLGKTAKIYGVDLNAEMVKLANNNFKRLGLKNCRALTSKDEVLPFADNSFDLVISNGVFNLSLQKTLLFAEVFRVLKPQGKLQFADIVLRKKLPTEMKGAAAWSN
ncbi:methyltransferase domain-containing protein [Desulfotalea psychrophila]|uniref:Arsenite methyltransferase n=1 Tax=Desulfotalea psychrophila (strain LSv54 / DSM 12343) TaxID=177439 RepID=Q6AMP4_DESPS|nr:methyltransferase domain-containing protein [Desulfotalea psychrophila]CAG36381.1 hypothetical protein DP1652 [Desulfotalea psychrophila LSv54]